MSLAAVPAFLIARRVVRPAVRAPRRRARRGAALDGVHGDRDDREPLLSRRARGRVAAAAVPGAARAGGGMLALLAVVGVRVRDPRAVARLRSGDRDGAARARSRPRQRTRAAPVRPSLRLLGAGAVLVVAVQAARGSTPADLLGAYSIVGEGGYDVGSVLRFWLWHLEELDLYVGIVPVAALLLLLALGRSLPRASAGAPRRDGRPRRVEQPRGGDVRLAVRLRPDPGPLPVLPRAAPARRAARLGRGRRAAASSGDGGRGDRGARPAAARSRTRASSASRRSRTRSGCCRCGRSTSTSCSASTGSRSALAGARARRRSSSSCRAGWRSPCRSAVLVLFASSRSRSGRARAVSCSPARARSSRAFAASSGAGSTTPFRWARRSSALWTGRADRFTINQNEFFNRRVGQVYYVDRADTRGHRRGAGRPRTRRASSATRAAGTVEAPLRAPRRLGHAGRRRRRP